MIPTREPAGMASWSAPQAVVVEIHELAASTHAARNFLSPVTLQPP